MTSPAAIWLAMLSGNKWMMSGNSDLICVQFTSNMRKFALLLLFAVGVTGSYAQHSTTLSAAAWVDSVFRTLSPDEKIAQLMVIRLSAIDPSTHRTLFYDKEVEEAVKKYNVGGICLFQGDPLTQASHINYYQGLARTPIL